MRANNRHEVPIEVVYADPPADLRIDAVTAPTSVDTGQQMAVSWRVTNHGTAVTQTAAWYDRVYLSADAVLDTGADLVLGTFRHNGAPRIPRELRGGAVRQCAPRSASRGHRHRRLHRFCGNRFLQRGKRTRCRGQQRNGKPGHRDDKSGPRARFGARFVDRADKRRDRSCDDGHLDRGQPWGRCGRCALGRPALSIG